jgi:hypothetical protein
VVGDDRHGGADEGQESDGGEHQMGEPPASLGMRMSVGARSGVRVSVRVRLGMGLGVRVASCSGVLVAVCHR